HSRKNEEISYKESPRRGWEWGIAPHSFSGRFLDASQEICEVGAEPLAKFGMLQRQFHGRFQVTQLVAAVVALAFEVVAVHRLFLEKARNGVGQLDLAARALGRGFQKFKDARRKQVTADDARGGGRDVRRGLFDDAGEPAQAFAHLLAVDDAVT